MPPRPKVLVVDDDESILSAFGDFLNKEQCTMLASTDADRAMRIIEKDKIDLLITDLRLKSQSGLVFLTLAKMKQQSLPVIAISGYPEFAQQDDVRKLGANYFFLKPLDLNRIREAVRECLHQKVQANDTKRGSVEISE